MAVHQCAMFSNSPRLIHGRALQKIGNYLSETITRGIIYDPNKNHGIECYVDADFAEGWERDDGKRAENFFISIWLCHILCWVSSNMGKQTANKNALSTSEAEYISLYTALREVIPFVYLLLELSEVIELHLPTPKMNAKYLKTMIVVL